MESKEQMLFKRKAELLHWDKIYFLRRKPEEQKNDDGEQNAGHGFPKKHRVFFNQGEGLFFEVVTLSFEMPKRELSHPVQVVDWLIDWGEKLSEEGEMVLIGSGGLLWHVHAVGKSDPLPENSMDVDPITFSEEIAMLAYDSIIGSEFEKKNGWHVNLMPDMVLKTLPQGWQDRCEKVSYGKLKVIIPSVADLLTPKLMRNEPRDVAHANYMVELGLYQEE